MAKKAAAPLRGTHPSAETSLGGGAAGRSGRLDPARLRARYERLAPVYEVVLQALHRDLHPLLVSHGFSPTIKYRVKRFEAYLDKILRARKQQPGGSVSLTDLLGARVICPFLEDIERVVDLLVGAFEVVEVERRGAERSYREFGYDSVHLLVKVESGLLRETLPHTRRVCEIQLRTTLQEAWAEVEHELVYKTDISLPNESIKRKLAALNANLTLADLMFQEIRDQQRELREHGRKRRESVTPVFPPELPAISALPSTDAKAKRPLPLELASLTGASRLERTLIEALQAHSGEDLETAVRLYGHVLRMKIDGPIRSMVYNHRGMARFALTRYAEALRDFTRAIQLDPGNPRGHTHRALTHRVLKDPARAMEDYNRALEIDPACLDALWGRAQTQCDLQLYTRALADCERALNIQPEFAPARELSRMIRLRVF